MSKQWRNWANSVRHENLEAIYRPTTLPELKANVKEASERGWKLRAVGSGHSWSNLGLPPSRGAIIQLDKLDQLIGVNGNVVEVQGGISIEQLNRELFRRGLALANMGDATPQAIAGAISTETHGSGASLGSLSELVEGITIVRADGQEKSLQGEELEAGRVSLGQLGAIYSLKLTVVSSYSLHHEETLVRFQDEKPQFADLLKNRHLEYWYYPYTGKAVRLIRNMVDSTSEHNLWTGFEKLGFFLSSRYVQRKARVRPESLPDFYRSVVNKNTFPSVERQGPWHKILPGKSNTWRKAVRTFTMEYQLPYERLWQAFEELEDSIDLAQAKGVFVGTPIQIRFTKRSERSLLSHFRFQPTVSFSISFFTEQKGVHVWLPELEGRLIRLDGRPHWGKMYYARPPKDPRFERIREKLDPSGTFAFEQPVYVADPEAFLDPRSRTLVPRSA